ncbi:hypothetical protein [Leptospira vanthielii]|nr:hypothetical protein [Leptospira vanthielii]
MLDKKLKVVYVSIMLSQKKLTKVKFPYWVLYIYIFCSSCVMIRFIDRSYNDFNYFSFSKLLGIIGLMLDGFGVILTFSSMPNIGGIWNEGIIIKEQEKKLKPFHILGLVFIVVGFFYKL